MPHPLEGAPRPHRMDYPATQEAWKRFHAAYGRWWWHNVGKHKKYSAVSSKNVTSTNRQFKPLIRLKRDEAFTVAMLQRSSVKQFAQICQEIINGNFRFTGCQAGGER